MKSLLSAPNGAARAPAVRAALSNRAVRDAQAALAAARAVDLAQLVVVSALLFSVGGAAPVASYGVVRTLVPAVGVPVVTALGSRFGHGVLLRAMGLLAAFGSLVMASAAASGNPTLGVLAGASVVGVAVGCFRPVISALLPTLVRSPDELLASNAATGFLDGASTLVGPVMGTFVAAVLGVPALLVLTSGVMLAAGLVAGRLQRTSGAHTLDSERREADRFAEYSAGVRELATNPAARLVTLLGTAQTIVRGATNVIVVVLAIEVLSAGASGVGALHGAIGVGGLIGLPLAVIVIDRLGVHRSLALGLAAWGIPLAVCAAVPNPIVALVLFGTIGVGNGVIDIAYYSVLQRAIADRVLTRVLGATEAVLQAGLAAGAVAGAFLLDHLGPRPALAVVGLALPLSAALATPQLWAFDRVLARRDQVIALLRSAPCFAPLPMTALDSLAGRTAWVSFAPGERIVTAGECSDAYVLIEQGHVEIAHGGRIRALLGPGQGFGALPPAVATRSTASARGVVSARAIDRSTFLAAIGAHPLARAAAVHDAARQWL